MGRFVDSVIALRILRILTTPFDETDAFKLGIIDEKGKELKKLNQLHTIKERDAYTLLHRMIFRIKRIIQKVPMENRKLSSYAAALSLVREYVEMDKEPVNLEELYLRRLKTDLTEDIDIIKSYDDKKLTFKEFFESAPANNAGNAGVAGFTPDSLGLPIMPHKRKKKKPDILRRSDVKFVGKN
tara:strand:- start:170 stop:721 length:552 start_codon:yes stop_codon:yes gene_type:complete